MATVVVFEGTKRTIELLCSDDGSCSTQEFLNTLSSGDLRKIDNLFELMGQKGYISNDQKFKKLEGSDGIFEFKSHQIRLLCFHAKNGRVIICRGLIKKKDRHDAQDIRYAEERRRTFLGE